MRLTALKQADRFLPAGSFQNNESNLFRHPAKSETIFSAVVNNPVSYTHLTLPTTERV